MLSACSLDPDGGVEPMSGLVRDCSQAPEQRAGGDGLDDPGVVVPQLALGNVPGHTRIVAYSATACYMDLSCRRREALSARSLAIVMLGRLLVLSPNRERLLGMKSPDEQSKRDQPQSFRVGSNSFHRALTYAKVSV